MKTKNYLWLIGLLFCATLGLVACSDDDEEGIDGNANELIVGTWHATSYKGYEIEDGKKTDFEEDVTAESITFNADGTGFYLDLDYPSDHYPFTWRISGNQLIIDEDNDEERYTIKTLNKTELVLEYYEKETYDGITYEYWGQEHFKRIG